MKITREQVEEIMILANLDEEAVRTDYSGRGMLDRECVREDRLRSHIGPAIDKIEDLLLEADHG